jgi:hypothetical protein
MRFPVMVVTGLVLIVLGIGLSEWSRRHPGDKPAPTAAPKPKPAAELTPEELTATESLADLGADTEGLRNADAELEAQAKSVALPEQVATPGARAVLGGSLFARNALAHGNAVFLVIEEGKQGTKQTVVRFTSTDLPKALAVHRPGITALAADAARLFWAEGGSIFSTDSSLGGTAKGLTRFPSARVTSLAAKGSALVATLVPKDVDPFSSDPVGAVVSISVADGKVALLAAKQSRPSEASTDGAHAAWIAGYPADLLTADLRTRETRTLAARADGPLQFQDGQIVFRHPAIGAPELQAIGPGDDGAKTIARGEIDRVSRVGDDVWYSIAGSLSTVNLKSDSAREVAKLPGAVLELAATDDALYALIRQEQGGHLLLRLPRESKP